jgi:uncharacterized protein
MKPIRILMLSDERPGHYRLSEGVVAAIERQRPVEVDRLIVRKRWPIPKGFVPKINRKLQPQTALKLMHGIDPHAIGRPDLIISAGAQTLGANAALAKILGVPNIFCGTTRQFATDAFSLVLTDNPSSAGPANVRVCLKPSPFDPDQLRLPQREFGRDKGTTIGVLIGGPTGTAGFDSVDWHNLTVLLSGLVETCGAKLTVVTGPRTPSEAYRLFDPVCIKFEGQLKLIDYRTTGPGTSLKALAEDIVLVTSDSMSMLTEAVLSGRPALALRPRKWSASRDDRAMAQLVKQNLLSICDLRSIGPMAVLAKARKLEPLVDNHLDLLSNIILPVLDSEPATA